MRERNQHAQDWAAIIRTTLKENEVTFRMCEHEAVKSTALWAEGIKHGEGPVHPLKTLFLCDKKKRRVYMAMLPVDTTQSIREIGLLLGDKTTRLCPGDVLESALGALPTSSTFQHHPFALTPPHPKNMKGGGEAGEVSSPTHTLHFIIDTGCEVDATPLAFPISSTASVVLSREALTKYLELCNCSPLSPQTRQKPLAMPQSSAPPAVLPTDTGDLEDEELGDLAIDAQVITDIEDPRVQVYRDLKSLHSKPHPDGLAILESLETIRVVLRSPSRLVSLLLKPTYLTELAEDIAAAKVPPEAVYVAQPSLISAIAGFFHRGALGAAVIPRMSLSELQEKVLANIAPSQGVSFLGIDGCNDVSNIGGLVRTACALGMDGVLLSRNCCDPFYRRAVRSSMGQVFQIPIVRCDDLAGALTELRATSGVTSVATVIDQEAVELDSPTLTGWKRWCAVVGNEHEGVSSDVRKACDMGMYIPMARGVDSLNINVAAGVFLFELRRLCLRLE